MGCAGSTAIRPHNTKHTLGSLRPPKPSQKQASFESRNIKLRNKHTFLTSNNNLYSSTLDNLPWDGEDAIL